MSTCCSKSSPSQFVDRRNPTCLFDGACFNGVERGTDLTSRNGSEVVLFERIYYLNTRRNRRQWERCSSVISEFYYCTAHSIAKVWQTSSGTDGELRPSGHAGCNKVGWCGAWHSVARCGVVWMYCTTTTTVLRWRKNPREQCTYEHVL